MYFAKKAGDFIMNTEIYAKVADFLNQNYSKKVGSELKVVNGVFINLDFWSYLRKCAYVTLGLDTNTNEDDELYKQKLEEMAKQVYVAYPKALIPLVKLMLLSKGLINKTVAQPNLIDWFSSNIDTDFKTGMNNLTKELGIAEKPINGACLHILFSDNSVVFDPFSGDQLTRQIAQQINQDFAKYDSKYALQFGYARTDGVCLNPVTEFGRKLLVTHQLMLKADGDNDLKITGEFPDKASSDSNDYQTWLNIDDISSNLDIDNDLAQKMQDMLYLEGIVTMLAWDEDVYTTLYNISNAFDYDTSDLLDDSTLILSSDMLRLIFTNNTKKVSILAVKTNIQSVLNRLYGSAVFNLAYNDFPVERTLVTPFGKVTIKASILTDVTVPENKNALKFKVNSGKVSLSHTDSTDKNDSNAPISETDQAAQNTNQPSMNTTQTTDFAHNVANSFGMTEGKISISCQYKTDGTFEYQNVFNFDKIKEEKLTCKFSLVLTCDISENTLTNFISEKEHRIVETTEIVNEVKTNIANICSYGLSLLSSGCDWAKDKLKNLHISYFTIAEVIAGVATVIIIVALLGYAATVFGPGIGGTLVGLAGKALMN